MTSSIRTQVSGRKESPGAIVEDPMHHKHGVAGAPLRVLDRTPLRRDDVAFHCGQPRARTLQILSVTEQQPECGDRRTDAKCCDERFVHDAPPTATCLASASGILNADGQDMIRLHVDHAARTITWLSRSPRRIKITLTTRNQIIGGKFATIAGPQPPAL